MKKKGLKAEKQHTWRVFSEMIRRDGAYQHSGDPDGNVPCYTCNKIAHWKELQAGHGLAGRNNGILFEEKVVKPQCVSCNLYAGGKPDEFHAKLVEEYGAEEFQRLVQQKHTPRRFSVSDLQEMRESYKERIRRLLES